jgi:hypothetical protein
VPKEIQLAKAAARDYRNLNEPTMRGLDRALVRLAVGDKSLKIQTFTGVDGARRLVLNNWRVLFLEDGDRIVLARVLRRPHEDNEADSAADVWAIGVAREELAGKTIAVWTPPPMDAEVSA